MSASSSESSEAVPTPKNIAESGTSEMERSTNLTVAEEDKRTPTTEFFKLTREEAVSCVNTVVFHETFDSETGLMKEVYATDLRSTPPPPPTGTIVYEVGTGRPYQYVRGMSLVKMHPDSVGMTQLKKDAAEVTKATTSQPKLLPKLKRKKKADLTDGNGQGSSGSTIPTATAYEEQPTTSTHGKGLCAVIPVPSIQYQQLQRDANKVKHGSPSEPLSLPSQEMSGNILPQEKAQTVMEKVLQWKTSSTPELLCTDAGFTSRPQPLKPPTSSKKVNFDICNCVALVTSNWINVDTKIPALAYHEPPVACVRSEGDLEAENKRILDKSLTLRHLRNGYTNYLANNISSTVHRLTVYSCKSPRQRIYNAYKSISCKPDARYVTAVSSAQTGSEELLTSDLYKMMVYIDQYLNVFSTLAEFNYKLSFSLQHKFGVSLPNVLIVDKLWTYSSDRRVFVPHYQMMVGDSYTESFVNEVRKLENGHGERIRHVRFLSTLNTRLYTNQTSLSRRRRVGQAEDVSTHKSEPRASTSSEVKVESIPLKKRRIDTSDKTLSPTSGTFISTVPASEALVLRMKSWPSVEHRSDCNRIFQTAPTAVSSSQLQEHAPWHVKNPTLIVFTHNLGEKEPRTLLCNILTEMHLGNETLF